MAKCGVFQTALVSFSFLFFWLCTDAVQGNAVLSFYESYPAIGENVQAECSTTIQWEQIGVVYFNLDGVTQLTVFLLGDLDSINLMPDKLDYTKANKKIVFTVKSVQSSDSDVLYSCTVFDKNNDKYESATTSFTTIVPPTQITVSYPPGSLHVFEGTALNVPITCTGPVGNPGGNVTLLRNDSSSANITELMFTQFSINPTTYVVTATYNVVESANASSNGDTFVCLAFNNNNPKYQIYSEQTAELKVEYAPSRVTVVAESTLYVTAYNDTYYIVNASNKRTGSLSCSADANPSSTITLTEQPDSAGVEVSNLGNTGTIKILSHESSATTLVTCSWTYTSSVFQKNVQGYATIAVVFSPPVIVPTEPSITESPPDLTWIIVGVILGVLLLIFLALLAWFLVIKKAGDKSAKQQTAQPAAARTVSEHVTVATAPPVAFSGSTEDDFRKEFPVDLVYVANEPKCRRPLVDSTSQSMFEYLGDAMLTLQPSKQYYAEQNDGEQLDPEFNMADGQFPSQEKQNLYY